MHWIVKNVYKILVENPEGKRSLGKPRHRGKINLILRKQGSRIRTGFM
jgi:hypothetical protein